jgi:membrane protein DedA with SNARE-associated domain
VGLDRAKLRVGRYLFARHGVKVVFFGRFVAVLRTFASFFAGVSKMRWSRFLVSNAAGGLLWAGVYGFGAYALGSAASGVGSTITIVGYVVAGLLTRATVVLARLSLRVLVQRAEVAFPDEQAGSVAQPQPVGN